MVKERYRLLDTTSEGILTVDPQGRIEYVNRQVGEILGYSPEQLLGRPFVDFVFENDRQLIERALSGEPVGLAESWDTHLRRPDGDQLLARLSASPIFRGGRFAGTLIMFFDTTDRTKAEQALRRSEEELRMVAEAIPQIVWTTTPEGFSEYFNQRWFEITGLSEEESFANGGLWKPIHPDDVTGCREGWQQALRGGESYSSEFRLRCADGGYRRFLGRAVPVRNGHGRIIKWVGTYTDLDSQKHPVDASQASSIR